MQSEHTRRGAIACRHSNPPRPRPPPRVSLISVRTNRRGHGEPVFKAGTCDTTTSMFAKTEATFHPDGARQYSLRCYKHRPPDGGLVQVVNSAMMQPASA